MGGFLSKSLYGFGPCKYNNVSTGDYGESFINKSLESDDTFHLNHHIQRELWKSNFSSPVEDLLKNGSAKVLDVGCGLGTFLCEISSDYPKSEFIGIDVLSLFPTIKPFNVNFIKKNIIDGLPFEDNSFDFVHIRSLFYDFTESQWMNIIYKETLRVLKPGGWLEIADPETRAYNTGPLTDFLLKSISKDISLRNISSCIVDNHESNLRTIISNNKNINEQKEKIVIHHDKKLYQIGKWSGKIGEATSIFVIGYFRNYLINKGKKKGILKSYNKNFFNNNNNNNKDNDNNHEKLKKLKDYEQLLKLISNEFEIYKTYTEVSKKLDADDIRLLIIKKEGFLKESTKINQESFPNSDKNEDECDRLLLLLKLKPSQNRKWLFNGENISKNLQSKKNKGIKRQTCSLDYGILNIQDPLANRYLSNNFIEHYKKFSVDDSKDYITIDDIGTKIKKLCLISDNLVPEKKKEFEIFLEYLKNYENIMTLLLLEEALENNYIIKFNQEKYLKKWAFETFNCFHLLYSSGRLHYNMSEQELNMFVYSQIFDKLFLFERDLEFRNGEIESNAVVNVKNYTKLTGEKCKHGNKVDGMITSKSIPIQWFWKELKHKESSKSDEDKIKLENGVKYLLVNLFLEIPTDSQDKFHDLEVYVVQAIARWLYEGLIVMYPIFSGRIPSGPEGIPLVVDSLKKLAALKNRIDENIKKFYQIISETNQRKFPSPPKIIKYI
nr:6226_t:CDS:10 [Entrophospora candida]